MFCIYAEKYRFSVTGGKFVKGLRHNVIEINDTGNENIERILVFLKPQTAEIALAATRAQATKLLADLEVKKVRSFKPKQLGILAVIIAAVVLVTAVVVML